MKQKLASLLENSIKTCFENKSLETADIPFIEINHSNEASHGDYATNLAMILASTMKTNPRKIASAIVENIQDSENILEKVEIAGPGFVNFFINGNAWLSVLKEVREKGENYGRSYIGRGKRVQVEFVSANPTGPLHIGHARGAAIGDVIANILGATGFSVSREYYINDAGNQMNNLGKSVLYRCRELLGRKTEYPKECYQGEYILDIAREIIEKYGPKIAEQEEEKDAITFLTKYAADSILEEIKRDLKDFGVVFDSYFSEKQLHENNGVEKLLQKLMEEGYVYKEDSTLWFKTTNFGDEKDRVVVRANGEPTYFAADIAYHQNKYMRGFDEVIDIWGADHHGYVPRMQAGIQALGIDKDALKIVLVQLVSLLRDGKPVAMSTRAGEFITLKEVVDEVGKDASRYNFLMRRSNSHLDFDLELAKKQSNENPVYYVQYAHARIRSIIRTAEEKGCKIPEYDEADLELLNLPEEFGIMRLLNSFPELVEASAKTLEPHRLTFYANDLASAFHSYYNKNRVVSEDIKLSEARLFLVESIGTVLKNVLSLMGISAPERM